MATFAEVYFGLRNKLRKFSRNSLLNAALNTLRAPYKDKFQELQSMPAQTLLLVKWICQDQMLDHGMGPPISQQQFDQIRQEVWGIPGKIDSGISGERPMHLFMRQLFRPQMGFQISLNPGFVRETALLESLPETHRLRKLWGEKTGLTPGDFMVLQYAIFALVNNGTLSFHKTALSSVERAVTPGATLKFLSLVSRTVEQLCEFVRSLPDSKDKRQSELFEFPVLSRYPFVSIGDMYYCWHPAVLYRGLESMVHEIMAEAGQEYIDSFSKIFERHVVEEAKGLGGIVYSEFDLRRWMGNDSEVPDALLSFPECNVLVESKAGLFDESVMAIGHNEIFRRKTRALQKGASQGWATSLGVRKSQTAPVQVRNAQTDYLLIVTNKELSAGHGTMLASMYPDGTLSPENPAAKEQLPLEHIYVISIPDYERLAHAVRTGALHLPTFLSHCVSADRNGTTSRFYMHQHLDDEKIVNGRSQIIDDALRKCDEQLTAAVKSRS